MKFYFREPRLGFGTFAEFFVRLVSYSTYAVLSAAAVVLLFAASNSSKGFGILVALFLADRLRHFGEAEKHLNELKGESVNLALVLTPAGYKAINHVFRKSLLTGEDFYLLLLRELLKRGDAREAFRRLDIPFDEFDSKLAGFLGGVAPVTPGRAELLEAIESLVLAAYKIAAATNEKFIEPRNLLAAISLSGNPAVLKLFELFNLAEADIQEAIIFGRFGRYFSGVRALPAALGGFANRPNFLRHRIMNRAWTAKPTPTLDKFSRDLTDLARQEQVGFLIGHSREFAELLSVISRPGKSNALIVGEPGIGKSTIISHLAFRMVKDKVPKALFDKRLVSLEIADLVANAPSEVIAGRLQEITREIMAAGNIILFIPNIQDLFRAVQNSLSAIDILLPIIKSEAIPVIGETYPREFKQFIEPRSDFLEQFEVLNIEEISEAEAVDFLVYNSLILEKEFKVFITFRAVKKAVELAHRYFKNKPLPGSAVDILKRALARVSQTGLKRLTEDILVDEVQELSKVPIQKTTAAETEKLLNLEAIIHERLINQDPAVKAVSNSLREYRSGLARKGGPIAAFLFVGPTGVGKTELAKILAKVQFGSSEEMRRFDMSEYQDKTSIFRFIGTPDGEKTGALTDAVLEHPYSLILLDEFEKAHPDILNLFLQVFDDGRLTDSLNRTVDFQNTIIIATSNAHSDFIKTEIESGKKIEEISDELKKRLTTFFKPELLNRFSDIIVFRNLNPEEILAVAKILVKEVIDALKETHGIDLAFADSALQKISELGYSPVFGARPLRQVIADKVKSVLAEKILRKEITRGDKLECVFENNEFQFQALK